MKDWISEHQRTHRSIYSMSSYITRREIIVSIAIMAIMLLFGFGISGKITDSIEESNSKYQKAIHITDSELFQYGMDTNVGNAFVYGKLKAVDTVTFPEIGGEYMYVEKTEEHYTKHTRRVSHTRTVNGKTETYYTTETYWTWDYYDDEILHSKKINFSGIEFPYGKIKQPSSKYIDTISGGYHVRYVYYGCETEYTGTIFTQLKDGTISDKSSFYNKSNIEESLEKCLDGSGWNIFFWIVWIMLSIGLIIGFCILENKWLE